jgi:hypothetical protein
LLQAAGDAALVGRGGALGAASGAVRMAAASWSGLPTKHSARRCHVRAGSPLHPAIRIAAPLFLRPRAETRAAPSSSAPRFRQADDT